MSRSARRCEIKSFLAAISVVVEVEIVLSVVQVKRVEQLSPVLVSHVYAACLASVIPIPSEHRWFELLGVITYTFSARLPIFR